MSFKTVANVRVKQYLLRNSNVADKKAIKTFFITLKSQGLSKARLAAIVKGSKNIAYLIDSLSQDYLRSKK